jgi:transcriptional regulator with XRE-family HTH domain
MNNFGECVREKREAKGLYLRQLAAEIEMDTTQLSKIERGERLARKEHIKIFADLLDLSEKTLLTFWLADQIYNLVKEEKQIAIPALETAINEFKKA